MGTPTEEADLSGGPARLCTSGESLLRWDLRPEQIRRMSDELVARTKEAYDAVGSLELDAVTLGNTLKALAHLDARYAVQKSTLTFPRRVSPSKEVRTASAEAHEKLREFDVDASARKDVYQRILALGMKVDEESLTAEDRRYLNMRLGISVKDIQDTMKLSQYRYINNLRSRTTKAEASEGSPGGLWVEALGMKVDARSLTEAYMETYMQPMEKHENGLHLPKDKRDKLKDIEKKLINKDNLAVEKVLKLRAQKSTLLGFKTYADFVLKSNMARSAKKVSAFLDELSRKLKPLRNKKTTDVQAPSRRLNEYFPLEVVTRGLLDICQDLLGLSFSLVRHDDGTPVWHPDVTLYRVTDRASGQTMGRLYLDLLSRAGKDGDAACFPLQPGCLLPDGSRQPAVAAVVTNFGKPPAADTAAHGGLPASRFLEHDDVVTFCHVMGHAVHLLCAQVEYAAFAAFHVEEDFAEAPSQLLENWAWEKESLRRMSRHHETGDPIPDDALDQLVGSRNVSDVGVDVDYHLMEIIRAKLDQALHTKDGLDLSTENATLSQKIVGVATFRGTDVLDSCDGQHYCYLWSEVLAADMFHSRFKQEGVMNPAVGSDYRKCILKPGASRDAEDMLRNFLGREPNQEAFLLSKGLDGEKKKRQRKKINRTR